MCEGGRASQESTSEQSQKKYVFRAGGGNTMVSGRRQKLEIRHKQLWWDKAVSKEVLGQTGNIIGPVI